MYVMVWNHPVETTIKKTDCLEFQVYILSYFRILSFCDCLFHFFAFFHHAHSLALCASSGLWKVICTSPFPSVPRSKHFDMESFSVSVIPCWYCWCFRHLANQLIQLVVYLPLFTTGFSTIPGGWPWDFWTILYTLNNQFFLKIIAQVIYVMHFVMCFFWLSWVRARASFTRRCCRKFCSTSLARPFLARYFNCSVLEPFFAWELVVHQMFFRCQLEGMESLGAFLDSKCEYIHIFTWKIEHILARLQSP